MEGLICIIRLFVPVIILLLVSPSSAAQCLGGDCQNGTGTFRYSETSEYTGQFQNGNPHGLGKMTYADGAIYEGPFYYGKREGEEGVITYINDDRYIGQWSNDFSNGKGKYYFKSGERFEGDFVNGEFDGQGSMYYTDGAYYTGSWKKSKKHGDGTLYYADGSKRSGAWTQGKWSSASTPSPSNNNSPLVGKPDVSGLRNCGNVFCRNGDGFYDYPDSSRWVGAFKDGRPSGRGICYYINGDLYEGEWANNAPCGEGIAHFASGSVYSAVWVNGYPIKELDSDAAVPSEPFRAGQKQAVKIWAVVVGVAKYTTIPRLKFSDDDAYRFYAYLKSAEGGTLPDEQVTILLDDDATHNAILSALHHTFLKADEQDVVVFYFSGHGLESSFLPIDFDGQNHKLLHEEIRQVFKQSRAKHKLCIADACHSGALDYSGSLAHKGPARVSLQHFYQAFEESNGGIALLMSSKPEELSMEDQGLRQGVFTHYLLRGMKGEADRNSDYIVTIRELYIYVYLKVREYTSGVQTPVLTGDFYDTMPVSFRSH
jgi:hypothetical protein